MLHLALPALLALSCAPSDSDTGADEGTSPPPAVADDADGDGISDEVEGDGDQDGDGVADYLDDDSDGDCIPDAIERGDFEPYSLPIDSDLDGKPDYLDLDSDDNSVSDQDEAINCLSPADLDGDGVGDWRDLDDDDDTLLDNAEGLLDIDGDGLPNLHDLDSDGDCIPDHIEAGDQDPQTDPIDTDDDLIPDFVDIDSDDDGILDQDEADGACDDMRDSDGDGIYDYVDPDIDGDGLDNQWEILHGTDPMDRDSDADGYSDGLENFAEADPLSATNIPIGIVIETGPRQVVEYADEYVLDEYSTDIFVLLDTAYSYSCYHPDLESFIEQLVEALFEEFEDAAIGFGTYDDYRYGTNWAASNGHPFKMQHQISTDAESVLRAAENQDMVYGGDALGSSYEALYQAATGHGFDQSCDQTFTNNVDVRPFQHSSGDAFEGAVVGSEDETVEGTGTRGGVGFRGGSSPIFVLAADNTIRNPSMGHDWPLDTCDEPAEFEMATAAVNALRGRILGVNVYEYQSTDATLQQQLVDLALATNSLIDTDGDGDKDDPAVLYGSWNWPEIDDVIAYLWQMVEDMELELSFQLVDDDRSWISDFYPTSESITIERGDSLSWGFELSTSAQTADDDQFYHARIEVYDEELPFDDQDIWVLIRPEFVP